MKILLADDDKIILSELSEFLENSGYKCITTGNGKDAIDILNRDRDIQVVISDIRMPTLDGIGLLKYVSANRPDLYVILITGYQDVETVISAVENHAYDFLKKPFKLSELKSRLDKIGQEMKLKQEVREKELFMIRQQRMEALAALFSGIMHEINNPNTFIMGNAQVMLTKLLPALKLHGSMAELEQQTGITLADLNRICAAILTGSERIAAIVNRGIQFSHRHPNAVKRSDAADCLESALTLLAGSMNSHVKAIKIIPKDKYPVAADSEELVQVFINLVINSIETGVGQPEIIITIRMRKTADRQIVIEIEDNGPGIAVDRLPRIFEPFYSSKTDRPGRGLGLFVVHQIIDSLQGTITAENIQPGRGARFRITIPEMSTVEELRS